MQANPIRIGTRGSPLALAQAHEVRARLAAAHGRPEADFEIVVIKTTGDLILDRPLAEVGGKGLFTKEIESALIAGEIDLAVHSMKDMQTDLPDGLVIGATLPREDVRDAFISLEHGSLAELPEGAVVGTSSLRRQAQVRKLRPDLEVVGFRGNVQTRLRKLEEKVAAATFLACAGLNRLGLADRIAERVPVDVMLPAVAQAAIGIEVREGDATISSLVAPLDDVATAIAVTAERAFLKRLEGSCRTPIAGLATLDGDLLDFRGEILTPDGRVCHAVRSRGSVAEAAQIGDAAALDVLGRAGPGFFTQ
ncbi:MAG: hydroxymethylbilane synthase [Hyphomicrobiaceae bacterium]